MQKLQKKGNQQRQYLFDPKTVTYGTTFCLGFTMFYCKCLVLSSLSKVDFFENKNSGRVGWIKVNLTLWRELSEVFAVATTTSKKVICSNKNQKRDWVIIYFD